MILLKKNALQIIFIASLFLLSACGGGSDDEKEIGFPYEAHSSLLEQRANNGPILVTSHAGVSIAALEQAADTMATMVRNRPDAVQRMRAKGTIIAVYGNNENICSLPYWGHLLGTEYCDLKKVIGVGNSLTSTCGERNLLKTRNDPAYRGNPKWGSNVCVHEFAHTIMQGGLTDAERERITQRYLDIQRAGLWKGGYAATNSHEFFAESTQSYFCANMGRPDTTDKVPNNCPEKLKSYDPETFSLLDSIYLGSANLKSKNQDN